MATMGIDTTKFDEGLEKAVTAVDSLDEKAGNLTSPKLGDSKGSALKPLVDDADSVDKKLGSLETKVTEESALMKGFADATSEVIEAAIEGIIEFGAQSIEAAASTGSALANAFNQSKASFEAGLDAFKVKVGEVLLPVATFMYDIGEGLMGITGVEKLAFIAQQIQSYSDLNLDKVSGRLESFFGLFDKVDDIEPGNVGDYKEGLESQTEYWNKYAETLGSLKEKGVDPEFLAEIATGSKESMAQLAALDAADAEGLESLLEAYNSMKEAQKAAAEGISETQLSADETLKGMVNSMATFASEIDLSGTSKAAAAATVQGMIDGLSEKYPALSEWVDTIVGKYGELGIGIRESPSGRKHGGGGRSFGDEKGEDEYDAEVGLDASEDSEGQIQGTIDGYDLNGDVSLMADIASGRMLQAYLDGLNLVATVTLLPDSSGLGDAPGRAVGLDYVPYDNYTARLHEGEAVLTKLEADKWRNGKGAVPNMQPISVTVNVDGAVRDPYEIADEVRNALELMRWRT